MLPIVTSTRSHCCMIVSLPKHCQEKIKTDMASVTEIILLVLVANLSFSQLTSAQNDGWEWIRSLKDMDSTAFTDSVRPLIQIAINTYRTPASAIPVPGWTLADRVPVLGRSFGRRHFTGPHALVFENIYTGSIVISFKGAQTTMDFCAVSHLFTNTSSCSGYSPASLDYLGRAVRYTKRVLTAYGDRPVLLSGHSMGSFLAVMTSATLSTGPLAVTVPVLSFSGAVNKDLLDQRGLYLAAAAVGEAYVVTNEWDSVGNPSRYSGPDGFRPASILCTYESQEPAACAQCGFHGGPPLGADGPCGECFGETHVLESLLTLGEQGSRAVCSPPPLM